MRASLLLLICGFAVAALSGQASAVSISFGGYTGPLTMHITNWEGGTVYNVADGSYSAADLAALTVVSAGTTTLGTKIPYTNSGGSDVWGIARVDQIIMGQAPGSSLFTAGTNGEILVIFYGEHDTSLVQSTTSTLVTQSITGTNFEAAFFYYPTMTQFTGTAGPGLGSGSTATPTYAGVTDITKANLLWTMRGVPGWNGADSVNTFFATFNGFGSTPSEGHVLAQMTGTEGIAPLDFWGNGPSNFQLDTDAILGAFGKVDVSINFNAGTGAVPDGQFNEIGNWLLQSNDPIRTNVTSIPEPMTMAGLLLGIGCLTRYMRKRS
jgi:hypothetical protein